MNPQPNTPMPHELVAQTIMACKNLSGLLEGENEAIKRREVSQVEKNLKDKERQIAKLDKLLRDVRECRENIRTNVQANAMLPELQDSFNAYQSNARQNMLLLKAAHDATTDFLGLVQQAVKAVQPANKTYSKEGCMEEKALGSTSIINKSI